MKKWLLLLVAAGVVFAWKATDAQSVGRRDRMPNRQAGNFAPQGTITPEPGTLALFASGAAPVILYALRRTRGKK